jgi:hypothetical protein
MNEHKKSFELFVDNEKYAWDAETITGKQLHGLASIPEGVEIFLQVPGHRDQEIKDDTVVDLEKHKGPARFSTQSTGSQAG